MGTPQTRCREMHHSDRDLMKDSRRLQAVGAHDEPKYTECAIAYKLVGKMTRLGEPEARYP